MERSDETLRDPGCLVPGRPGLSSVWATGATPCEASARPPYRASCARWCMPKQSRGQHGEAQHWSLPGSRGSLGGSVIPPLLAPHINKHRPHRTALLTGRSPALSSSLCLPLAGPRARPPWPCRQACAGPNPQGAWTTPHPSLALKAQEARCRAPLGARMKGSRAAWRDSRTALLHQRDTLVLASGPCMAGEGIRLWTLQCRGSLGLCTVPCVQTWGSSTLLGL